MRRTIMHGAWLAGITAAGFALFCLLLASGIGASPILFYRGLVLAAVAALGAGVAGALVTRRLGIAPLGLSAALACFSISTCFLVLFPVTIDRSVSVYLLATLAREPGGMTPDALERAFVAGYVRDMRAIDRRIEEQRRSGNIVVGQDGRARLTPQGERFVAISRAAAAQLGTDPRFVAGYRNRPGEQPTTTAATRPR